MSNIKTADLFDKSGIEYIDFFVFSEEYPWMLLPQIKTYVNFLIEHGMKGFVRLKDDVLVGENVNISPTATIIGPTIIGNNVEIRPGAYIRGNVIIGDDSVVGNSSELKNCVLMRHCQCPHFNYVGDSILGNHAHTGAGVICSNLRSDGKAVIIHDDEEIETGLRKVGAFLGDHADIGCQSVLNPGTVIGKNTQVYPLTMTRGVYKSNAIVKSTYEIVDKED